MAKIDPKEFNTDPKYENERTEFDTMIEGAMSRIIERKKKEIPPEEENMFDSFFGGLFSSKKKEG